MKLVMLSKIKKYFWKEENKQESNLLEIYLLLKIWQYNASRECLSMYSTSVSSK